MVCRCCITSTSAVICAAVQLILCLCIGMMLGENIHLVILATKEPANIDLLLMGFMIALMVCALAVLYGIVARNAKPIICVLFVMLVIFLICTIRLGYMMYILGNAVQKRDPRDRITRLGEATAVIGASWFFLLLSLMAYNRAREDIE
ncbi:hypothetical protein PENTCL1PPCAC_30511 [Pristionchus entomophagus]|uniref:Uncharacterized protein n=1 Tax=Pristionchus entomophagus TaxID=358040 RepID=A0AAV5UKF9_9BILA|nr:hypothetical protein PENTCL1PPCAC_28588 [Pristionchus entomophagus]GMT08337.1 hypothetical protein PENTCL1PPCAC_30511 [Pristionchus entomophagus]